MSGLTGKPGELRATVHVTRAATGETETFEIIGHPDPEKLAQLVAESKRNRVHGASGAMTGQIGTLSNQPEMKE